MNEFVCEPLSKRHDRSAFQCGQLELDRWFQQQARQDQVRMVAAVYVFVPRDEPTRIAGYYSLSATSVELSELPPEFAKKLPRYPMVPAILFGRLARDVHFPGIGEQLLVDAMQRSARHSSQIAAAAVVVDAIDDRASGFYQRFGLVPIQNTPERLFLPMATIKKAFSR